MPRSSGRLCSSCGEAHPAPKHDKCKANLEATLQSLVTSLSQVTSRLDNMEQKLEPMNSLGGEHTPRNKQSKKTPDPKLRHREPSSSAGEDDDVLTPVQPSKLQKHKRVQEFVDRRMRDLGVLASEGEDSSQQPAGKSKKSGRVQTASDFVVQRVEWPHFHIFRGHSRQPATYDELSVQEFVCGYLAALEHEPEAQTKELQLKHLRHLMQDCAEYGWQGPRNFHGIFLQEIEKGRCSWSDIRSARVQDMRRQYSQAGAQAEAPPAHNTSSQPAGQNVCYAYQAGTCKQETDHKSPRGLPLAHVCGYCLKKSGKRFPHPERDCRRKGYDTEKEQNTVTGSPLAKN